MIGIDISNWQAGFDLGAAASSIDFVILKASEWGWKKDPTFDSFASTALAHGLRLGAYMFARDLSHGSVSEQVAFFMDSLGGYRDAALLVLDFEDTNYSHVQGNPWLAKEFLDEIRRQSGKTPMLYTSQSEVRYNDYSGVTEYPLWGACYLYRNMGKDIATTYDPDLPGGGWGAYGDRPAIYQYSSDGHLIGWELDANVCYLSESDWDSLAGGGSPQPQPQPSPDDPIDIDGYGGRLTITKLQAQMGSPYVDGRLSGQYRPNYKFFEGFNEDRIDFDGGSGESWCVRELQRRVGADPDGVWGRATSSAVQRKLQSWGYNIGPDGADSYFGHQSMRALQASLNDGRWKQ